MKFNLNLLNKFMQVLVMGLFEQPNILSTSLIVAEWMDFADGSSFLGEMSAVKLQGAVFVRDAWRSYACGDSIFCCSTTMERHIQQ